MDEVLRLFRNHCLSFLSVAAGLIQLALLLVNFFLLRVVVPSYRVKMFSRLHESCEHKYFFVFFFWLIFFE